MEYPYYLKNQRLLKERYFAKPGNLSSKYLKKLLNVEFQFIQIVETTL